MTYQWADGSHFKGPVEGVVEALEKLRQRGGMSAREVVIAARNERSALHPHIFALSDKEAALEHRLELARSIVRSIVVVNVEHGEEVVSRAYHFVQPLPDDEGEFTGPRMIVTRAEVMATPLWRRQVVERLRQSLMAAQRDLQDFATTALTRALPKVVKLAEKELQAV